MPKFLAVYSIAEEDTRTKVETAIDELDPDSFELIFEHATAFRSEMEINELHKRLVSDCIDPGDEIWILTLEKTFTGNGFSTEELKELLKT